MNQEKFASLMNLVISKGKVFAQEKMGNTVGVEFRNCRGTDLIFDGLDCYGECIDSCVINISSIITDEMLNN